VGAALTTGRHPSPAVLFCVPACGAAVSADVLCSFFILRGAAAFLPASREEAADTQWVILSSRRCANPPFVPYCTQFTWLFSPQHQFARISLLRPADTWNSPRPRKACSEGHNQRKKRLQSSLRAIHEGWCGCRSQSKGENHQMPVTNRAA